MREAKVSVREYAWRFTQLSKYSSSIVADLRANMSKFVSSVSDVVVKECRTAMLVHDMYISHLMVHTQQIEEEKLKGRYREVKRARVDDGNYSHARSGGRGRPRFCQKFSGKGYTSAPPRPRNERIDNKIRDFFSVTRNEEDTRRRAQLYHSSDPSGSGGNTPKQNRFYALQTKGNQEGSPDVVTGMLKVFYFDVYALVDPGATLSFVNPLVATRFDMLPDLLLEPFFCFYPQW
ncbi:uncharacterized protein LOC125861527 [Solanum stenotomum]|uniref:uncharacterized protein LOC125861527 n=1 Tax=Solanum stenotomum TaxID=172797 RepID=UPI0020D10474|nr:uncharacterized protein LOC125861527 [Solanum stenotomum]